MADASFASRLKAIRDRAGITRYALAKRTGIGYDYIHRLESGARDTPSWEVVCKLADALGVDVNEFRDPPTIPGEELS